MYDGRYHRRWIGLNTVGGPFHLCFVYLTPLLEGLLAERYLGLRKSVTIGASIPILFLTAGSKLLRNIGIKPASALKKKATILEKTYGALSKIEKDGLVVICAPLVILAHACTRWSAPILRSISLQ